jgi:hypothetical protein
MSLDTELVEKIISIEWESFISVNEGLARASCQEDRHSFEGMRAAQFRTWNTAAATSYLDDLESAKTEDRNLVEEKYIHMMKTTAPGQYDALSSRVTQPSGKARALAHEISDLLLEQANALYHEYPCVAAHSRPLSPEPGPGATSVETYQLCELLTYSERTLAALREHYFRLAAQGVSAARDIMENTARFYGYDSLESAEAAAKKRNGNE